MTKKIEYDGESKTVAQWAQAYKIPTKLIEERLARGWKPSYAITAPEGTQERHHMLAYTTDNLGAPDRVEA